MKIIFLIMSMLGMVACQTGNESNPTTKASAMVGESNPVLSLFLTDNPADLKAVNVNIKSVILKLKGQDEIEVTAARNYGVVNLLEFQNNKLLLLDEIEISQGMRLNQIRLVLEESNNTIEYHDQSICNLQIPSQAQSGLKILAHDFLLEKGKNYAMVIDFDAKKSLVFQGNGGCLLKPVLKLISLSEINEQQNTEEVTESGPAPEEEVTESNPSPTQEEVIDPSEQDSGLPEQPVEDSSEEGSDPNSSDICNSFEFDIYDESQWSEDFVWENYSQCY